MKYILISLLCLLTLTINAQIVTAFVSTNGPSPIPSFALGKPAGLVFMSGSIGNLEFAPDFTFDLETGKGWFMDTWIKWNQPLDTLGKWTATAGINWSLFFQPYEADGKTISQSVRYPTFQGKLKFSPTKNQSIIFDYWYTQAIEKEFGSRGSYISLAYIREQEVGVFKISESLNTFYLKFSDGLNGLAQAFDASISHKSGIFFGFQLLYPITEKKVEFEVGCSLGVTKKFS